MDTLLWIIFGVFGLLLLIAKNIDTPVDSFGKITMSETEYNAALNKAMLKGYELGLETGRQEGLMSRCTPNEIRKCLGLESMTEEPKTNLD